MNLNNTDYKLTMYKKYIIGLFTLCCAGNAAAQSLAQAKQLFLNGEFEQAKPAKSWQSKPLLMPIIIIGMVHVVMKQEKKKKHSPTLKKAPPAKSLTHTAT